MNGSDFLLSQTTENKLMILESALQDDDVAMFIKLSMILLDAPITEGGLPTEMIEEIRLKYNS